MVPEGTQNVVKIQISWFRVVSCQHGRGRLVKSTYFLDLRLWRVTFIVPASWEGLQHVPIAKIMRQGRFKGRSCQEVAKCRQEVDTGLGHQQVEGPGRTGQRLVTFFWQADEHLHQHILFPAPPIWEDFRVLDEFGKRNWTRSISMQQEIGVPGFRGLRTAAADGWQHHIKLILRRRKRNSLPVSSIKL